MINKNMPVILTYMEESLHLLWKMCMANAVMTIVATALFIMFYQMHPAYQSCLLIDKVVTMSGACTSSSISGIVVMVGFRERSEIFTI